MKKNHDAIVLFSGGLDSLLAAKLLAEQGLNILCVHFHTPFFGRSSASKIWIDEYGLDVLTVDLSFDFIKMMVDAPAHGYGKRLNPCVDCKILQLSRAREIMEQTGAKFIATGEVPGQRPMSQRKDALNLIAREAGVKDLVLRPLSALILPPAAPERNNEVDRSRLLAISGRGRTPQYELAAKYEINTIPAPAGGCSLTQEESARRYWRVLEDYRARNIDDIDALRRDLTLASLGRCLWRDGEGNSYWLVVGRKADDNQRISEALSEDDLALRLANFPGPIALCRHGREWPLEILESAASLVASYSARAMDQGGTVLVRCFGSGVNTLFSVLPEKNRSDWGAPSWEEVRKKIRGL